MSFIKNLFKKEVKSYYGGRSCFIDTMSGNIIGGIKQYRLSQEIQSCLPVQIAIERTFNILQQATLVINEKSPKTDTETTDANILQFLDLFQKPQSRVFPTTYNDILKAIHTQYYENGIVGIIIKYDNDEFSQTFIPNTISYQSYNDTYLINTTYNNNPTNWNFVYNDEYLEYIYKDKNITFVLYPIGNFDINYNNFISPLHKMQSAILLYNRAIEFARAFQENSCRPLAIITANAVNPTEYISDQDLEGIIKDLRTDLQGAANGGKAIFLKNANLKLDYQIISTPSNAQETIDLTTLAEHKIYSFLGLSKAGLEGINEYSNNATINYTNIIKNTLNMYNIYVSKLDIYFQNWLLYTNQLKPNTQYYLTIDINNFDILAEQIRKEKVDHYLKDIISKNEVRGALAKSEEFADYTQLPPEQGDTFYNDKNLNQNILSQ